MPVEHRRWFARAVSACCCVLACAPAERVEERAELSALGASERALIIEYLARHGVPARDVSLGERRVFLQRDAFFHAQDVLRAAQAESAALLGVNKGRVPTQLAL